MVVVAIVAVVLIFAVISRGRSRLYRYAGWLALTGHLVFAVLVLPRLPYDWDVDVFHDVAIGILQGADTNPLSSLDAFGTVQAVVYAVFGADPTTLAVCNGLLAVLLPLPIRYVAKRLHPSLESTDALTLLVLFLPLPFLFHSLPMRDSLSTLSAVTLLAICVGVVADRRYRWAPTIPPLWALLFLLREELALLILLGAMGAAFVAGLENVLDRDVSLASLVPVALPIGVLGFGSFAALFPVDVLNASLQYRTMGGAAYLEFMRYGSWLEVILAAPVRAIYFQFAPFPLQANSAFDVVALSSLPILIVLATTAVLALDRWPTDVAVQFGLLVVYVGGVVGYGLIDANFGTTIRHRAVFVFLLAIFSAPVLEGWLRSLRGRVDEALRQRRDHDEQQEKAEKLDPGPQVR